MQAGPRRIRRRARAAREPVEQRLTALMGGSLPTPARSDEPRPVIWRVVAERHSALAVLGAVVLAAGLLGWRVAADRARSATVPAVALSVAAGPAARALPRATSATGAAGGTRGGGSGVTRSSPSLPASGSGSGSAASSGSLVVVDVVGRVRHPGLVRLPTGSRVDDAVRAAGGALPGTDLASLNLARVLVDGEQIGVGRAGAAASGAPVPTGGSSGSGGGSGSGAVVGPVNLNTATLEQLDGLPGVGPVLAQHILDWRQLHGRFDSVDQLGDVSGIGDAKFADLKPLVTV